MKAVFDGGVAQGYFWGENLVRTCVRDLRDVGGPSGGGESVVGPLPCYTQYTTLYCQLGRSYLP